MIEGYHYLIENRKGTGYEPGFEAFDEPTIKRIWDYFHDWPPYVPATWKHDSVPQYDVIIPLPNSKLHWRFAVRLDSEPCGYDLLVTIQRVGLMPSQDDEVVLVPQQWAIWRDQHTPNPANPNTTDCWACGYLKMRVRN